MRKRHSDATDDKPLDIVCSGGIKIDFGQVFNRPQADDKDGDDCNG